MTETMGRDQADFDVTRESAAFDEELSVKYGPDREAGDSHDGGDIIMSYRSGHGDRSVIFSPPGLDPKREVALMRLDETIGSHAALTSVEAEDANFKGLVAKYSEGDNGKPRVSVEAFGASTIEESHLDDGSRQMVYVYGGVEESEWPRVVERPDGSVQIGTVLRADVVDVAPAKGMIASLRKEIADKVFEEVDKAGVGVKSMDASWQSDNGSRSGTAPELYSQADGENAEANQGSDIEDATEDEVQIIDPDDIAAAEKEIAGNARAESSRRRGVIDAGVATEASASSDDETVDSTVVDSEEDDALLADREETERRGRLAHAAAAAAVINTIAEAAAGESDADDIGSQAAGEVDFEDSERGGDDKMNVETGGAASVDHEASVNHEPDAGGRRAENFLETNIESGADYSRGDNYLTLRDGTVVYAFDATLEEREHIKAMDSFDPSQFPDDFAGAAIAFVEGESGPEAQYKIFDNKTHLEGMGAEEGDPRVVVYYGDNSRHVMTVRPGSPQDRVQEPEGMRHAREQESAWEDAGRQERERQAADEATRRAAEEQAEREAAAREQLVMDNDALLDRLIGSNALANYLSRDRLMELREELEVAYSKIDEEEKHLALETPEGLPISEASKTRARQRIVGTYMNPDSRAQYGLTRNYHVPSSETTEESGITSAEKAAVAAFVIEPLMQSKPSDEELQAFERQFRAMAMSSRQNDTVRVERSRDAFLQTLEGYQRNAANNETGRWLRESRAISSFADSALDGYLSEAENGLRELDHQLPEERGKDRARHFQDIEARYVNTLRSRVRKQLVDAELARPEGEQLKYRADYAKSVNELREAVLGITTLDRARAIEYEKAMKAFNKLTDKYEEVYAESLNGSDEDNKERAIALDHAMSLDAMLRIEADEKMEPRHKDRVMRILRAVDQQNPDADYLSDVDLRISLSALAVSNMGEGLPNDNDERRIALEARINAVRKRMGWDVNVGQAVFSELVGTTRRSRRGGGQSRTVASAA